LRYGQSKEKWSIGQESQATKLRASRRKISKGLVRRGFSPKAKETCRRRALKHKRKGQGKKKKRLRGKGGLESRRAPVATEKRALQKRRKVNDENSKKKKGMKCLILDCEKRKEGKKTE